MTPHAAFTRGAHPFCGESIKKTKVLNSQLLGKAAQKLGIRVSRFDQETLSSVRASLSRGKQVSYYQLQDVTHKRKETATRER